MVKTYNHFNTNEPQQVDDYEIHTELYLLRSVHSNHHDPTFIHGAQSHVCLI